MAFFKRIEQLRGVLAKNANLLKGSGIIFSVKMLLAGIGFISTMLITRYSSSQADVGSYFFILSLLALLSTVARGGFDNVTTRFVAMANKDKSTDKLLLVTRFIFKRVLLYTLIGCGVAFLIFTIVKNEQEQSFYVGLTLFFTVLFLNINTFFVQCFQGVKKITSYAIFNGLSRGVFFILLLCSIPFLNKFSLFQLVIFNCISYVISASAGAFFWKKIWASKKQLTVDDANRVTLANEERHQIVQSAYTLWGTSILAILMANSAPLILGLYANSEQVALMGTALRIGLLLSFILTAINGVLSPQFAELSSTLDHQSTKNLQALYRTSTGLMLAITLPLLVMILIFSEWLMGLFGEDYLVGANVLRIIVCGYFIKVLVGSVGQLLVMTGHEKLQRRSLALSVSLLLVLLILLSPLGALGGAMAIFLAVALNNLLVLFYVRKYLNISLF